METHQFQTASTRWDLRQFSSEQVFLAQLHQPASSESSCPPYHKCLSLQFCDLLRQFQKAVFSTGSLKSSYDCAFVGRNLLSFDIDYKRCYCISLLFKRRAGSLSTHGKVSLSPSKGPSYLAAPECKGPCFSASALRTRTRCLRSEIMTVRKVVAVEIILLMSKQKHQSTGSSLCENTVMFHLLTFWFSLAQNCKKKSFFLFKDSLQQV